jgi:nucleotide-binding universal stress UspA family protein
LARHICEWWYSIYGIPISKDTLPKILCPIDFDDNAPIVLGLAARLAAQNDGAVYVLHVMPMILASSGWGAPIYGVGIYKDEEESRRAQLLELSQQHLSGIKHEQMIRIGEPLRTIIQAEKQVPADLVVMATHGRRGFSRAFLGSVAEAVVRRSYYPILTVHSGPDDKHTVGHWMTTNPITATPTDKLIAVQQRMQQHMSRSTPVIKDGKLAGIITEHDLEAKSQNLENTLVEAGMTREVLTMRRTSRYGTRLDCWTSERSTACQYLMNKAHWWGSSLSLICYGRLQQCRIREK